MENGRLIYPDALNECCGNGSSNNEIGSKVDDNHHVDDDDNTNEQQSYNEIISNVFFDLANANEILYRVRRNQYDTAAPTATDIEKKNNHQFLIFQQDMEACSKHTGGIIWETSYLLLEYILAVIVQSSTISLGRTCELGAGVGFLGQCIVAEHCSTCTPQLILTETTNVVRNLHRNVIRNQSILEQNKQCTLSVAALDWTCYQSDIQNSNGMIQPHSYDTLLSTDVIFSTIFVEPLLQTAAYLSHTNTIWYLCVQIRCCTAHELFIKKTSTYGFHLEDISQECYHTIDQCKWGETLECFLFRLTRIK